MKNNDFNGNREAEKLLKDKMEKLSSSVDCFDRISAKAFPERNADFSESGFVVCDLENITGRSRKTHFLKWTAVAVGFAVCVAVIPKTPVIDNITAHFGKSTGKIYNKIIDEINTETSQNDYRVYDITADDYIRYDRLITPLYSCPFENCGKDGVKVKIFVRTYNDIPTNQIYAVEYSGEYEKSNFIAVADSSVKFTEEDFEEIEMTGKVSELSVNEAVKANFTPAVTAESYITDRHGDEVSIASFDYKSIFKNDDGVREVVSQVLYYGYGTEDIPEKFYYDIKNTADIDTYGVWKHSLCFDGFTAMPEESRSLFVRTPLFEHGTSDSDGLEYAYAYVTPDLFAEDGEEDIENLDFYSLVLQNYDEQSVNTVAVPFDSEAMKTLKMYFSQSGLWFSSYSDVCMAVVSYDKGFIGVSEADDESYHAFPTDEEAERQKLAEIEEAMIHSEDERYSEPNEQEDATSHYEFEF